MEARAGHEARFLARRIPAEAHLVALVQAETDDEREAARGALAADVIATNVARRREHTLLTSLDTPTARLDRLLAPDAEEGLPAALDGRKRLSEIAVRRADRPFVYLPMGRSPPEVADLLSSERFRLFVERVRQRAGMLLIYVSESALTSPALSELLDGYVALGDVQALPPSPTHAMELGRLGLEAPASGVTEQSWSEGDDAADDGEGALAAGAAEQGSGVPRVRTGAWRRHRVTGRLPLARIGFGGIAVAVALLGWWVLARRAVPGADADAARQPAEMASPEADIAAALRGDGRSEIPLDRVEEIFAAGTELPYSVLLASFAAGSDAAEKLDELRADGGDGGAMYFVAPTPVRGAIYHRVFAGARRDRAGGIRLMEALVADGRKPERSEWDVRPARLAFRLGVFGSRERAETARRSAEGEGVVAYVLSIFAAERIEADSAFVLYAGAYESEAAAGPLSEVLQRAGVEAELVVRRGEPR